MLYIRRVCSVHVQVQSLHARNPIDYLKNTILQPTRCMYARVRIRTPRRTSIGQTMYLCCGSRMGPPQQGPASPLAKCDSWMRLGYNHMGNFSNLDTLPALGFMQCRIACHRHLGTLCESKASHPHAQRVPDIRTPPLIGPQGPVLSTPAPVPCTVWVRLPHELSQGAYFDL